MKKKSRGRFGFALIEFIVVLGIVSVLLPAIFTLYLVSIQNQQKAKVLIQVKQNGDNAMSIMESLIQNQATAVYDPADNATQRCVSTDDTYEFLDGVTFRDKRGALFTFRLDQTVPESEKIASTSASGTVPLTSNIVDVSSLSFSCVRPSQFSPPIISIAFTISQKGNPGRHENKKSLDWATNVKLRN